MATTFEQIAKANETIITTGIERYNKSLGRKEVKQYAEVPQRVKAFRMVYPGGGIRTELLQDTGERCTFRAEVYDNDGALLGSGTAFEEKSGKINTTSYIENCETSAVGRALAFAGFGIDTSIASAEELQAALAKQEEEQKQKEETNKSGKNFETAPKNEEYTPPPVEMFNDTQNEAVQKLLTDATPERIDAFNKALDYYKVENVTQLTKAQGAQLIRRLKNYE